MNILRRLGFSSPKMTLHGLNSKHLKKGDPEPAAPAAGKYRLYNMRFCPFAERTVLYLARKGIECEIVNINLIEKPEWYFKIHPQGKVPALEHDGKVVLESALIPQYLDDLYPNTTVLPKEAYPRVQQKVLVEQLSGISTAFYGMVASMKDPSLKEEKLAALEKALEYAEKLLGGLFFGGSEPSFCDYMIFPHIERVWWISHKEGVTNYDSKNFPSADKLPKLTKWFHAMMDREELKSNVQKPDVALKFMQSYMSGAPDYDIGN